MINCLELNKKVKKLAKSCFKNADFGFDFITKVLISMIIKKPYYIAVDNLHINTLKSIIKIFNNYNFFNINMHQVDNFYDIAGFKNSKGWIDSIGFAPKAEIVFLDNIWETKTDLIGSVADLIANNNYHVENLILESRTKIFIATSTLEQKPSIKNKKIWDKFFIKDQYISKIAGLDEILDLDKIQIEDKLSNWDLEWISNNYVKVSISNEIFKKITDIHEKIALANFPFEKKSSDFQEFLFDKNTWIEIIKAIKIYALIKGKNQVSEQDFSIIIFIVSALPIQYDIVERIIEDVVGDFHEIPFVEWDSVNNKNHEQDQIFEQKETQFPIEQIKSKIDQEIAELKNNQNFSSLKPEKKILQPEFNNKPRIYNENDRFLEVKSIIDNIQASASDAKLFLEKVENKEFNAQINAPVDKLVILKETIEVNENTKKIKNLEKIVNGSYMSFRKMIFQELAEIKSKQYKTSKKIFRNDVGNFYLANDDNEQVLMIDVKSFNKLEQNQLKSLVFICSKADFINNSKNFASVMIHVENNQYYLVNKKNRKSFLTFILTENQINSITPELISIRKIQRFIQESQFLMSHFESIAAKMRQILNNAQENSLEHSQSILALTNITLIKGKVKSFTKWIKNSNASEGLIENFLPEYSLV